LQLPRQGIEVRFFDHKDPEAIHHLIDDKTKMVFAESIGNPLGNIIDIQAVSDIAHEYGVPVVIDNTVATPALCRPFEFGADIVIHSLTKYMSGTGTSIGGAIVDGGSFAWGDYPERFPLLNTPDDSYHGVNFVKDVGAAAFIARARVAPLRNTGAALSPLNAFSILQGMETLSLRMERHVQNAQAVAEYLRDHDEVAWVKYAGLPDHPEHKLAKKYMKGTPSAILTFGVKGGLEAGARFIDALQLITRLVNIGDAKSLACHPATTTHRQLNGQELEQAGVSDDMVRLSIGIEHIEDIKADLAQALASASV
jgi:O-acetylhomoserine (thiol)-lyase